MEHLEKFEQNPFRDFYWNLPEQKQGRVNVLGGNAQNFRTPVKIAEYLGREYRLQTVNLVVPDALQGKLPAIDGIVYLPSTESGSLAGAGLREAMGAVDYNLLVGDFSKNSITMQAVADACGVGKLVVTRDAVDLIAEAGPELALMNGECILLGSLAQMQKIFRAVYYPRVLLMSQSLVQVADALHKFTLSYPATVVTLHNGQILAARDGKLGAVALETAGVSPLTLWTGELAAKIAILNLFNPGKIWQATIAALFPE